MHARPTRRDTALTCRDTELTHRDARVLRQGARVSRRGNYTKLQLNLTYTKLHVDLTYTKLHVDVNYTQLHLDFPRRDTATRGRVTVETAVTTALCTSSLAEHALKRGRERYVEPVHTHLNQ